MMSWAVFAVGVLLLAWSAILIDVSTEWRKGAVVMILAIVLILTGAAMQVWL